MNRQKRLLIGIITLHACENDPSPKEGVIGTTKKQLTIALSDNKDTSNTWCQNDSVFVLPTKSDTLPDGSPDTTQIENDTTTEENVSPLHFSLEPLSLKKEIDVTPPKHHNDDEDNDYDTLLKWRIERGVTSSISNKSYHAWVIALLHKTYTIEEINGQLYVSFILPNDKESIKQLLKAYGIHAWGLWMLKDETLKNIIESIAKHITANNELRMHKKELQNLQERFISLK